MTIIWYMVPDTWSMKDNFLSFWAIFCCFTPLTNWKITILKKFKKHLEILSFCTSAPKIIICYTVPGIWHMTEVIFFPFWAIFCPFTPNSPKNQNKKKKKKHLVISSFYTCVLKIMITWCTVPEIWCMMDRWMDRWKNWHIEVSAPPKNDNSSINTWHDLLQ